MSHVLETAWFDSSEENKKQKQKATGAEERTEAASKGRKSNRHGGCDVIGNQSA